MALTLTHDSVITCDTTAEAQAVVAEVVARGAVLVTSHGALHSGLGQRQRVMVGGPGGKTVYIGTDVIMDLNNLLGIP